MVDRNSRTAAGSYCKASEVEAWHGQVIVDGPDGVAVTLTPDAAEETGRRLQDFAREARDQAGDDIRSPK
jgi:hypothetical protein